MADSLACQAACACPGLRYPRSRLCMQL